MADYNTNENGMSRRNFLRIGVAVTGTAALRACSPFEKMPESYEPPYLRFTKETLDSLAGGKAAPAASVDWMVHKDALGDRYATALNWVQRAAKAASGVVKGHDLHLQRTLHSIHGDRKELADSQKLEGEAKAKFIESYVSSLTTDQKDILTDAYTAREALKDALTAHDAHAVALAEVQNHVEKNTFPAHTKNIEALMAAYGNNAKQIQANLRAQIWMNVAEARYAHTGSDLGMMIALDDSLEKSQSKFGFTDQGRVVYKNLTVVDGGKTVSLGEYKDRRVEEAEKHFKARDRNFEHDIILDSRVPIARRIFQAYADGKLSLDQAQGAYHVLDAALDVIARTPAEGKSFLETIWGFLPFDLAATLIEDAQLWGASNAPTGNEARVLKRTSQGYVGWPQDIAGSENIAGRDALALLGLALWGGAIYGATRTGGSSSSSGQSGQGTGGGQTTITPIR